MEERGCVWSWGGGGGRWGVKGSLCFPAELQGQDNGETLLPWEASLWVPRIHGLLSGMRILAPCLEAAVTQSWSVPWFVLPAPSSLLPTHQRRSREELLVLPSPP